MLLSATRKVHFQAFVFKIDSALGIFHLFETICFGFNGKYFSSSTWSKCINRLKWKSRRKLSIALNLRAIETMNVYWSPFLAFCRDFNLIVILVYFNMLLLLIKNNLMQIRVTRTHTHTPKASSNQIIFSILKLLHFLVFRWPLFCTVLREKGLHQLMNPWQSIENYYQHKYTHPGEPKTLFVFPFRRVGNARKLLSQTHNEQKIKILFVYYCVCVCLCVWENILGCFFVLAFYVITFCQDLHTYLRGIVFILAIITASAWKPRNFWKWCRFNFCATEKYK